MLDVAHILKKYKNDNGSHNFTKTGIANDLGIAPNRCIAGDKSVKGDYHSKKPGEGLDIEDILSKLWNRMQRIFILVLAAA